jgi:hypothetical protein
MRLVRNHGWLFGAAFALVAALVGCDLILGNELNPKYCAAHPDDADCLREMPTGHFPCKSSADCVGQQGEPACTEPGKNGFGICVQCTVSDTAACVGTTPLCGEENVCRGCSKHADCASAACLPDGSCVDEGTIAYVAGMGTGTACTRTAPCGTLAAAVGKGKAYVKVAAGAAVKDTQVTVIDGKAVTILADEGAKLDRDGDGAILEVRSAGADVKIFDLEITGASGSSGANGIDVSPNGGAPKLTLTRVKLTGNQGLGLSSTGGAVTVTQSTIAGNTGGGVSITNATFDITNNFIYRNGNSTTATVGGASIAPMAGSASVFAFNTVADNQIQNSGALAGGVFCDTSGFAAVNNLVVRNYVNNDPNRANANTSGLCTFPTSTIAANVTGLSFARPDDNPYDYHLKAGSSAIDQAISQSTVAVDVDGDARPQGAQKDIGADEYKP